MAFTVTPTSGSAPYVLSATFGNKDSIDNVDYALELRTSVLVGSCFVGVATGNPIAGAASSLLNTGVSSVTGSVPAGSCRTYSLIIRDLSNNSILASQNVNVNNV